MRDKRIDLAQRAVVLQVLSSDRPGGWARKELEPIVALERLVAEGVLVIEGERVRAARAVRYLDTLGLIAV